MAYLTCFAFGEKVRKTRTKGVNPREGGGLGEGVLSKEKQNSVNNLYMHA